MIRNIHAFYNLTARRPMAAPETPVGDFPLLRAHSSCCLCGAHKAYGLVTCWTCYNEFDGRNGYRAFHAAQLQQAEDYRAREAKRT